MQLLKLKPTFSLKVSQKTDKKKIWLFQLIIEFCQSVERLTTLEIKNSQELTNLIIDLGATVRILVTMLSEMITKTNSGSINVENDLESLVEARF